MKKIKLTKDKFAIVDNSDFDYLNQFKWWFNPSGYAMTSSIGRKKVYMHKLINQTPVGFLTDHINRNKLDNRRVNLRSVKNNINSINRDLQVNNTSGVKGVSWNNQHNKWEANVWVKRVKISLGEFKNFKEAVLARKIAEETYYGL